MEKVYYKDFYTGKKRYTTGQVSVKEGSWLGVKPVKIVYVTRPGSTTVIPEWCLEGESRNLTAEKEC